MRDIYERVGQKVNFPLMLQGTAPRNVLLDRFRTTPNAVLFATSSFWQGVDVRGDQLSCVIIDKLPFAVPSDPIAVSYTHLDVYKRQVRSESDRSDDLRRRSRGARSSGSGRELHPRTARRCV